MARDRAVDVLILGGGPAGSTAGALLAAAGIETVIVEAEHFPRFHVGESLLPHNLPLFDRLGVHDAVRSLPHTRRKDGASFVTHDGSKHVVYWFDEALPPALPHAYQVRRDELDEALLDNARAAGAEVLEGWRATAPKWDGRPPHGPGRHATPRAHESCCAEPGCSSTPAGSQSFLASPHGLALSLPEAPQGGCCFALSRRLAA